MENPGEIAVKLEKVQEAEADEMWSFVREKANQRWLWHAIDHDSGTTLAYVLGTHEDSVLITLKERLAAFGIQKFYTDD